MVVMAQKVKNLLVTQETWVQSLDQEDFWNKEMAVHSSILAFSLGNPMDRGAWKAIVHGVVGHN